MEDETNNKGFYYSNYQRNMNIKYIEEAYRRLQESTIYVYCLKVVKEPGKKYFV